MRLYARRKKNGERVWWAAWTEGGVTLRRSTRTSSKPAAELLIARWERERADPVYEAATQATLGSEYLVFLEERKAAKCAEGTLSMYRQKAGNIMRIIGKDTKLATIDATVVGRYFASRTDEETSDSTRFKEWVTLVGILKSARRRDRFHRDPETLKPPGLAPNYQPKERYLTPCEVMALLEELTPARASLVAFVIATGARRAEWERAAKADVDKKAWEVRIRGSKTKASKRTIPVPAPFRPLLERALQHGPPFAAWDNARRDLAAACKRVRIAPVTWNDLRRTFASLLFQLGVAPHVIGRLLGHTTSAMAEKTYARATTASLGDLLDRQLVGHAGESGTK